MKKRLFSGIVLSLFLMGILTFSSCSKSTNDYPVELLCEYKSQPLGIDQTAPRLGWQIASPDRGVAQTAYRILVASSPELLNAEKGDIWDSGKVESDESTLIEYAGKPLESGKRYYWMVQIWNQDGAKSKWSEPSWFETGLLNPSDWKAQWIASGDTKDPRRSVIVRKEFDVNKPIESARLYVTGLGNYVANINGKKVGDQMLTPGWTDYYKRLNYQVYDVTDMLKEGSNAIAGTLGNMWWSSGLGWMLGDRYSEGPLRFLAQLEITYTDGSKEDIVTDETWNVAPSPITSDHIYGGEHYDAQLEQDGWNLPGFKAEGWKPVIVLDTFKIALGTQVEDPIRITTEMKPVKITEVKNNDYVFDFGQNMVGLTRLKVKGKKGTVITLRYAELLHPDGTVAQENLRKAKATDTYTLKGGEEEIYIPSFTYHGFRYVQVNGLTEKPTEETLVGLVFNTDAKEVGSFHSSNELLNQIWSNSFWGLRGNIMSVPTDCPQRDERLGWMGDGQIFAPTAFYNMRLANLYGKWTRDMRDGQNQTEGWVTDVNPAIVVLGPSKPAWGDAIAVVPWTMYEFYGDKKILEDNYEAIKKWVGYMDSKSENNLYFWSNGSDWYGYGDWVPVVPSPTKPIGGLYYYYCNKVLSEMAKLLGKDDEAKKYADRLPLIAKAYQDAYYNPATQQYEGATQSANLLPLYFGITPEDQKEGVLKNLVADIKNRDTHVSTGFIGSAYILPLLSENGQHELAYQLATQRTYPSWGYMVDQGATTVWELWNSDKEKPEGMNSRNHFTYGSVAAWYYGYLAGIRPNIDEPGFKKITIAPMPAGDLTFVKASTETLYGTIASEWEKHGNEFILTVNIPANTTAEVSMPATEQSTITESDKALVSNGKKAADAPSIQFIGMREGRAYFNVGSGTYTFTVK
ncbi:MAG: glycoside hydrolase family 78 protein [Bacteroidales bacterium]|nr:glycoside hydrolase family 78 protein [Bacteroidales bacterium]